MFAHIHSKPGICSDDGRALNLCWYVQTAERRDQKFWSNAQFFPTEEAARKWCAENAHEITGVAWL